MDLTTIQLIVTVSGTVLTAIMILYSFLMLRRTKDEAFEYAGEMVEKFHEFYVAEKADLAENIPKIIGGMISAPIMSQMGKKSGLSRQIKSLEKDVIGMGIDQVIPGGGTMLAGLAQKHPILMQLAPLLLKRRGQGQPQQPQGGNGVGYG